MWFREHTKLHFHYRMFDIVFAVQEQRRKFSEQRWAFWGWAVTGCLIVINPSDGMGYHQRY